MARLTSNWPPIIGAALGKVAAPADRLHRNQGNTSVTEACRISVAAFEALGKDGEGSVKALYHGEAGEAFAAHLRALVSVSNEYKFDAREWPSVYRALTSGQSVKPRLGSDPRVFIWGALEARLQDVETVILGRLEREELARPSVR
jgi:ATP-dependent helicase/nuclease subunit B